MKLKTKDKFCSLHEKHRNIQKCTELSFDEVKHIKRINLSLVKKIVRNIWILLEMNLIVQTLTFCYIHDQPSGVSSLKLNRSNQLLRPNPKSVKSTRRVREDLKAQGGRWIICRSLGENIGHGYINLRARYTTIFFAKSDLSQ